MLLLIILKYLNRVLSMGSCASKAECHSAVSSDESSQLGKIYELHHQVPSCTKMGSDSQDSSISYWRCIALLPWQELYPGVSVCLKDLVQSLSVILDEVLNQSNSETPAIEKHHCNAHRVSIFNFIIKSCG